MLQAKFGRSYVLLALLTVSTIAAVLMEFNR